MKKIIRNGLLLLSFSIMISCTPSPSTSQTSEDSETMLRENTMLHFTFPLGETDEYPFPFIGDVHPYFDEKTQMWYMYYLDTTGQFNSKLLTSRDGISWVANDDFWIHSGLANYGVLNVFEKDDVYYSYYAEYHASKSTDLINWYYAGGEYQIPHDRQQFPGGLRDPSVTYDEDTDAFYAIALNYPRRIPSEGIYESNLAITKSIGNNQFAWESAHNKVFAANPINQDFEVPQLMKIGRRWYVVYSQYGKSPHGVGPTSYLIGDLDKNPYEINWQTKIPHLLTSEDLCAAQIARKGDKYYIFGWIPKMHNGSFWGGYINLPTEVYALSDGTLATRLEQNVASKIRGSVVAQKQTTETLAVKQSVVSTVAGRFDYEVSFSLAANGVLELRQANNNYRIVITNKGANPKIAVLAGTYTCFEYELRPGTYDGTNILRVIGEGRNLQLELNDQYALTSRIAQNLHEGESTNELKIISAEQTATIYSVTSYNLKYLNEI